MDPQVFYEVLVPLMEVEGTATICISTPLGQFNFYSELTEVCDENGKRVFNVLMIPGTRPPPWKTQSSRSRIKAIYGQRSTLYKREIMGQVADEAENAAFNPEKLKRFFDSPPLSAPYEVSDKTIYVSLDPNGGASSSDGPGSETAIVSFVASQGRIVIVGLETHPTKDWIQPRHMLYDHVKALRTQAQFRDCRIMLILEANLGYQAQMCAQYFLRRGLDADVLCAQSHTYGIFTNPGDPERYVMSLEERLAVDGLAFHDNLVCVNRFNRSQTASEKISKTLREFKRQLMSFRAVHVVPSSLGSRVRVLYTGKADKDGKRSRRLKDDMAMALLFGFFYFTRLHSAHNLVRSRNNTNMLDIDPSFGSHYEVSPRDKRRRMLELDDDYLYELYEDEIARAGSPAQTQQTKASARRAKVVTGGGAKRRRHV